MANPSRTPVSFLAVVLGCTGCAAPAEQESGPGFTAETPYAGLREADPEVAEPAPTAQQSLPERGEAPPAPATAAAAGLPAATLDEMFSRAREQERMGRHREARQLLQPVVAGRPDDASAWLWLARVELALGAPEAAEQAVDRAEGVFRRAGTRHPDIGVLRGVCALHSDTPERGVRLLREELADGDRPAEAAMHLADHLGRQERLVEAIAVLDAALERAPRQPSLELAKSRLLMDLGRFDQAMVRLEDLAKRHAHPRFSFELAMAQRAVGRRETAKQTLEHLLERFADHPWVVEHCEDLQRSARMLSEEGEGRYSARDLVAILRGSPNAVLRVEALRTLAAARVPELEDGLRLAMADTEYVVRLEALRAGWWVVEDQEGWVQRGLADAAPAVRAAAAELAAGLPKEQSITLLLSVLDSEDDGYVFEKMHDVLRKLAGTRVAGPSGRATDEGDRDEVRAFWRRYWDR